MSASLSLLDPYHPGTTWVYRADARGKLLVALSLVLAVNVTPVQAWPVHLAYLLAIGLTIALAQLPLDRVLRRSLLAAPFLLLALIGTPFVNEGRALWQWPILSIRLTITDVGLWRLANVAVKAWLSLLAMVTLTLVTPFVEIVHATQRLGLPTVLSSVILLMYRYLFVLVDEAQRLMRARDARTGEAPRGSRGHSLRWRAQVTGHLIGTLFLRTLERSERIYQAMIARGFDGEIHCLATPRPAWRQVALATLIVCLLAAGATFANLHW